MKLYLIRTLYEYLIFPFSADFFTKTSKITRKNMLSSLT